MSTTPAIRFREFRKATTTDRELRAHKGGIELRQVSAEEKAKGYIGALTGDIPFNTDSAELRDRSLNGGKPFVERLAADCFKRSLAEDKDQMGFAGHTDDPLAAFARVGENLTITADESGIHYRALIPDTQAGRDIVTLAEKRIIRGTSFEFRTEAGGDKWEKRAGVDVRTITSARLYTVNPVADPAYPTSELTAERGRDRDGGERRGYWVYQREDFVWTDPTVTGDATYALAELGCETCALSEALRYLRAAPAGALREHAAAKVASSAAAVASLTAWLAANGAQVNPEYLQRAQEKLSEAREKNSPAPSNHSETSRESALRILSR